MKPANMQDHLDCELNPIGGHIRQAIHFRLEYHANRNTFTEIQAGADFATGYLMNMTD